MRRQLFGDPCSLLQEPKETRNIRLCPLTDGVAGGNEQPGIVIIALGQVLLDPGTAPRREEDVSLELAKLRNSARREKMAGLPSLNRFLWISQG